MSLLTISDAFVIFDVIGSLSILNVSYLTHKEVIVTNAFELLGNHY